jgi:hypothetical protein
VLGIIWCRVLCKLTRRQQTAADRQAARQAGRQSDINYRHHHTTAHHPTPHGTLTHLIGSDDRSGGDRKAKVVKEAVGVVVEVSYHVTGAEGRRYDAPHNHILLEGFRDETRVRVRSDGGIVLYLIRNSIQSLSGIFFFIYLSFVLH